MPRCFSATMTPISGFMFNAAFKTGMLGGNAAGIQINAVHTGAHVKTPKKTDMRMELVHKLQSAPTPIDPRNDPARIPCAARTCMIDLPTTTAHAKKTMSQNPAAMRSPAESASLASMSARNGRRRDLQASASIGNRAPRYKPPSADGTTAPTSAVSSAEPKPRPQPQ